MLVQGIANRLRTRYKAKGRCLELDAADLIETLTTRVQALEQTLREIVTELTPSADPILRKRIAALEQERDELASIAGRVVIRKCFTCGEEYPQFSVLSRTICERCRERARGEQERERIRQALEAAIEGRMNAPFTDYFERLLASLPPAGEREETQ